MMKHMKRVLALMLVFVMTLSMISLDVSASEVTENDDAAVSEEVIKDGSEIASDNTVSDAEPASDEVAVKAAAVTNEPAVTALTMGTKPADGTTVGNPFVKGTGGSNSFRIPSMVTLKDGTIVAAADARWNTTYDGGGLDTIVSYSKDNGANWNYTFANYLGDNGNVYNGSGSTAFIDPALATDGETVYMLVDLYPYGVALNGFGNTAPSTEVGFNSDGRLKLAANGSGTYNYYLKDGQIYDSSNNVVSGYTVDEYFNITGNGYDTNLFFSDSPYQVVRTGYLYLTKSIDGGKTWSEPTLIPNVKNSSEQACLVGPGRGIVNDNGIYFPVYSFNNGTQYTGFIHSTDGGKTWERSGNATSSMWSSESAIVELSDGTLRFFFRNGNSKLYYVDYNTTANSWENPVDTGIATNSNTQISAISYSKLVGGKQVILVSCPTGFNSNGSNSSSASDRLNGKIFVGYVNSDGTMDWQNDKTISVTSNNNPFMYSCLTELADGRVAILYENQESAWGTGDNFYYTMDFQTYDLNLEDTGSSGGETEDPTYTTEVPVELEVGETSDPIVDETGNYSEEYTSPDSKYATMTITGKDGQEAGVKYTAASVTCNNLISSDKSNWTAVSGYYYTPDGANYYPVYAKRSRSWSWSGWEYTYTYTWGYSTTSSASDVTQIGQPQSTTNTDTTPNITVCTQSTTVAVPASTTITFTGVAAGETTAIVGTTLYKITVKRVSQDVSISVGGAATYTDSTATSGVTNSNPSVVEAKVADGKITFTGLKDGTATVTTKGVEYKVTVNDGTPISIKENETKTISVDLKTGETVTWSSADSNYVGVAGKYNTSAGAYTNEAILAGQNVTDSPVAVIGTIKDADGNVVRTVKWLVTVTEGDADTNTSSKGIYFNIATIEHCTVYYSINGGELIPVNGTGVTTGNWTENGTYKGHFNIMFFAAPDEGYALTYMSISGSADQYYTLSNGNPDGTGSDAWPFKDAAASTIPSGSNDSAWKTVNGSLHGFRWALLEGNMTIDQMKVMFSNAIALGCDGATTITKNANDGMGSVNSPTVCKFVAQKLPTVEKTIKSITRNGNEIDYTNGMKVELGDKINYSVVVTRYATNATYGTITYDNEKLEDDLTGNNGISNPDMGTSTTSNKTYPYTTSLTLTLDNYADVVKDGKITNTVDFSYSYSSQYSAGSLKSEANAVADIIVSQPEYVIDFGLPVEITLDSTVLGTATIVSGTAKYGTVTANENGTSFTYTPNTTVKDNDHVTLMLNNKQSYGVSIIPATTVYYEEGFATYSGNGWSSTDAKSKDTQQTSEVGAEDAYNYGYDEKYAIESYGASNGTEAVSTAFNDSATFEFTGRGVDIYANCNSGEQRTGIATIRVKNADGKTIKLVQVDTATGAGSSNATDMQAVESYNLPIASLDLENGSYTVKIVHSKRTSTDLGGDLRLDGFRVYGTLDGDTDAYVADEENNPTFVELRDQVLQALHVKNYVNDSQYASQIAGNMYSQVFSTADSVSGAVLLSGNPTYSATDVKDLLDNGPKNELFVRSEQSVVFKVDQAVQVGMKAVDANVTYTINNGTEKTLTSSTDMFYPMDAGTITITNKGEGILSITDIKFVGKANNDSGIQLLSLRAEDFVPALMSLGYEAEPNTADAIANINLVDYTGKVLATTSLTANGEEGSEATFAAADIQVAAEQLLPEGYAFVDLSAITDQTVVCGESEDVNVQIGKVATLKVTYKNLFGKTVGTATLTAVQTTSEGSYTFSASEIRKAAPSEYWTGTLISTKVKYGSTGTRTVIGF